MRTNNVGGLAAPTAPGANAIAAGFGSSATGDNAIGIGAGASASGLDAVAIGRGAIATNGKAVSVGSGNMASGNGAVAIGDPNMATGTGAVAIGNTNTATGQGAVALGNLTTATGRAAIAIGDSANAMVNGAIAIGDGARATGTTTTAIGSGAMATGNNSVAVGAGSSDGGTANVFAVGSTAQTRRVVNVAPGTLVANGTDAVNAGQLVALSTSVDTRFAMMGVAPVTATNNIALGLGSSAGTNGSAYGGQAAATGSGSVAVGFQASAAGANGVAIGNGALVQSAATNAIAIGAGSVASAPNSVSFGSPGNERRLTNIAPGVDPTDAVTLSQLNGIFGTTRDDIRRANGGVAMALAASTVQLPLDVGEMGITGGIGVFQGQTSLNFKYQMRPSEDFMLGVGVGVNTTGGNVGASAGVGYKWR